mgnify:CR=1 FL=1
MAIPYLFQYANAMSKRVTNRHKAYDLAANNFGVVTTSMAQDVGIPPVELRKLVQRGALDRIGRGVYRVPFMPVSKHSDIIETLKIVGEDAYLVGTSVLSFLDIGVFNPRKFQVSTPRRIRKALPPHVEVEYASRKPVREYEGVPCESVYSALSSVLGCTMSDRFSSALRQARERGLLDAREYRLLVMAQKKESLGNMAA